MPYPKLIIRTCLSFVLFIGNSNTAISSKLFSGQVQPSEVQEVFLTFKYRGTGTVIISALYYEDRFYLPITELFKTLMISYNIDLDNLTVSGAYLSKNQQYELSFNDQARPGGRVGNRNAAFGPNEFIVGELDFYLLPRHFSELFGLDFKVDFNNLMLSLKTDNRLPIEERMERDRRRRQINERKTKFSYYPLEYDRERKLFGGAFVDYSLNSQLSDGLNQYTYNLDIGNEILGGDVQGAFFGAYNSSSGFSSFSRNLRWRYVPDNRDTMSELTVGQINSRGLLNNTFNGIRITNEPVEPRILFQDYIVDGNTIPQSEVEVYLNNSLIDYQEADETGYYRFQVPLTYGTSRLQVLIYRPDGSRIERNERVQIPYTFLREGEFQYDVSAGQAQSSVFTGMNEFWQVQGSGTYGLASWLTAKGGIEYYEPDPRFQPLIYGSLSARIASQYLINVDAAPNTLYRANANVIYPSSVSLNASYTLYDTQRSIFNVLGIRQEMISNVNVPFYLRNVPFNFRLSANHQIGEFSSDTRYRVDFSSRLGRLNMRLGYMDRQNDPLELVASPSSVLTGTATYIFPRSRSIPPFLKGLYLRTQLDFRPYDKKIKQIDLQVSKSILREGRIQLSVGRDFNSNFTFFAMNFTFDFNKFRFTSSVRSRWNSSSFTQNIRGSIGYDHNYNTLYLSNRQQTGRSAASVRFFVDDNNSGRYEKGEQILLYNAARINKSAARSEIDEEGITRLTQLQSYYRYNFEINQAAIKNPIIVPKINKFSFVADPNQFKQIDVPFYVTGIIEGMVYRQVNETRQPVAGAKLFLKSSDGTFFKELRTFSDGSFYTYEIPPDDYILYINPSQLSFLDSFSDPDTIELTIEPKAEGDYASGLEFIIKPNLQQSQ